MIDTSLLTNGIKQMVSFLDQHSGAMIVLFTALYVLGTLAMWYEMRKTRIRLDEANIQVTFEPRKSWGNFFDLVIKNLGNTSVFDLKFKIDPKELKTLGDKKLEDLNLFKKNIPVFSIGEELRTFAITYPSYIHSKQPKQFSISVEYKTKDGKTKKQKYNFDMEIYEGMSASSEKSLNEVVEQIENLNKNLDKIIRK